MRSCSLGQGRVDSCLQELVVEGGVVMWVQVGVDGELDVGDPGLLVFVVSGLHG